MAKLTDWWPGTRQGQIDMGKTWINVMNETVKDADDKQVTKWKAWGIPEKTFMDLGGVFAAAQAALTTAKNAETRTAVSGKACEVAFNVLEKTMRDLKRRYFFVPPLTEMDIIALGLKNRDTVPAHYGPADGIVAVSVYQRGLRELGIRYELIAGNPLNPGNNLRMVWYQVVGAGEKAPEHPDELSRSFFTRRQRDTIFFDYGDSGKTVYIAVQTGRGTDKGPWGTMISAVIP